MIGHSHHCVIWASNINTSKQKWRYKTKSFDPELLQIASTNTLLTKEIGDAWQGEMHTWWSRYNFKFNEPASAYPEGHHSPSIHPSSLEASFLPLLLFHKFEVFFPFNTLTRDIQNLVSEVRPYLICYRRYKSLMSIISSLVFDKLLLFWRYKSYWVFLMKFI